MKLGDFMEDKRNIGNLSYDEFNSEYKKDLLNDSSISYLVRQMISNDCFQLEHNFYWVKSATDVFRYLDEYFNYNIPDTDFYELKSKFYLNGEKYNTSDDFKGTYSYYYYNTPQIKVCSFESVYGNTPYNMYTDGFPGEFHYVLKEPVKCKDLVDNDIGVLSIHANPCSGTYRETLKIEKDYSRDGLFIEEDYTMGPRENVITAKVYDLKAALERERINPFDGSKAEDTVIAPLSMGRKREGLIDSKKPWFLRDDDLLFQITVRKPLKEASDSHKFKIDYRIANDPEQVPFGVHTEEIEGESIYSAYYKYMVEKGFFKENPLEYEDNGKRF